MQELSRKYRRVIAAEPGYELAYYDYSQFEPGIMASLSRDVDLISLYNAGDIYAALSDALFGNVSHRDLCKRIFLAYSYGMAPENISRLLAADSKEAGRSSVEDKVRKFFAKFRRLGEFKGELEMQLRRSGAAQTLLGNHRARLGEGELKSKERRWAVNQVIQGNASLIFKRAVIELGRRFGLKSIILPMHDAILMQFPLGGRPDSEVGEIMTEAFRVYCPSISPRVTVGSFS